MQPAIVTFTGAANGGQTFGFEVRVDAIAIERSYLAGGAGRAHSQRPVGQ